MVFITILNHKTQFVTPDPKTTTTLTSQSTTSTGSTSPNPTHSHLKTTPSSSPATTWYWIDQFVSKSELGYGARISYGVLHFVLHWTHGGEASVVEFEWRGVQLGWRLGEEREIVDLGLLTQTKISKNLLLRPKSPSLFHLSKALKSLSQIVDLEKSLKLSLGSMVVKWWLVRWSVGVDRWMGLTLVWVVVAWWTDRWQLRGWGRRWFGFGFKVYLPPISHRSVGLY